MTQINFKEQGHEYSLNGKFLQSVSSVVSEFFPKFNESKMAKMYAKSKNLNPLKVLREWERIRTKAAEFGTRVHKYAEDRINNDKLEAPLTSKEVLYRVGVDKYLSEFGERIKESELIVGSGDLRIAGTIDVVGNNFLADFKTSREINIYSKYNKKCYIFPEYDASNYVKYSMQLSLYKILYDKPIKDLYIIHIKPKDYKTYIAIDFSRKLEEIGLKNDQI